MSTPDLMAIILVPETSIGDEAMGRLIDAYRSFLMTSALEATPWSKNEDRRRMQALQNIIVNGIELTVEATPFEHWDWLAPPEGHQFLVLRMPESNICDLEGQHDSLLEVVLTTFRVLGGLVCVAGHEELFEGPRLDLRAVGATMASLFVFSQAWLAGLGVEVPAELSAWSGESDGCVWLRFQDEFYYGMPEERRQVMGEFLKELWSGYPG